MKKIIASIFLLLFMISICIINMNIITNISHKSIEYTDKIIELNNSDMKHEEELAKVYQEFEEYWNKKSNLLSMLIYHDPLDEITEQISKLSVSLQYNEKFKISESLNIIKTKMIELSDNCKLDFKNLC